ncbi:NusA-like transcription termination signal-binding factor [Natrialba sp. SSL1]|uniref:NusA-like transcription termination signal-binding factor n=1 Tax=Natrialba sp. SSL1 TaxID=1869245 RepID=UPI0008F95818|nr:NusA-like transcription termination signal-binding factor [Natrialba sp. SSL1]OIB57813.1 transcription elongation factor NusA [Natrialba sp. SSL1]
MAVTLDDDARQYLATFEEVTGADGTDCILDGGWTDAADEGEDAGAGNGGSAGESTADRLIIVVASGQMGEAIGPEGRTIQRFEDRVDLSVRLVENAADPETFVANTLAPAAVYNVTISENNDTVAYVEVADADRGIAIGTNGRTIDAARRLAERHFDIDDIQLT